MKIRLRLKPNSPQESVHIPASVVRVRTRPLRVLDFDIENRPLSYLGSDFTTAEVTAISWAWTDRPEEVTVRLLGETLLPAILREFLTAYDQADIVTGHFIRGHDLPMLNGALMELGMPALSDKLTQDTKIDLMRAKGISKSQESLGAMFKIGHEKVVMNQAKWRAANRLTPEGLEEVRKRVVGDVQQHIEMRQKLIDLGYLGPAVMWRSGSATIDVYTP